jgi:ATP-dependent Clp protease adaptor protein ClpS
VEAVIAILVGAAGVAWWKRTRTPRPDFEDYLDDDARVVLHVAEHEQRSRGHATLGSLHVLYGLLQDETIAGAVRAVGGDVAALEDRVLAALDVPSDHQAVITADVRTLLLRAAEGAYQQERETTVTDLWAYLLRSEAAALLADGGLDALGVLHVLVHATALPALADGAGEVHVVIRNDDYTTRELVIEVLVGVFALTEESAQEKTLAAHTGGKAIVARLPMSMANERIRAARELARAQRFPLWIAAEPV